MQHLEKKAALPSRSQSIELHHSVNQQIDRSGGQPKHAQ
jgi:hypothetical protein